ERHAAMRERRGHVDHEVRADLRQQRRQVRADRELGEPQLVAALLDARRVDVDPADELGVGARQQLPRPGRAERARADDDPAQRPPAVHGVEAHLRGAAHSAALASTRWMSGWWYTGYSWSPGLK